MSLIQKSADVFVPDGPFAAIGAADLDQLRAAVAASPRRRVRINAHPDSEDPLHEMIIAIDGSSYIRPHRHRSKSEAYHLIEGEVDIVIFADDGAIDRVVPLGAPGGARPFYFRMSRPLFHTLVIRTGLLIMHEITNGPFRPDGSDFAPFAPDDRDSAAVAAYRADLARRLAVHRSAA
jgi:cupin fold WbuC family metalloprotein